MTGARLAHTADLTLHPGEWLCSLILGQVHRVEGVAVLKRTVEHWRVKRLVKLKVTWPN